VSWFDGDEVLPDTLHLSYRREPLALRYGENPHQSAALYRDAGAPAEPWWATMTQHAGMALSYLNLYDADAAWLLAHDLAATTGKPAVAIIKHANPCGAAVAGTLADAYQLAFECDERSAFGGIVATSEPIDEATVERMVAAAQADVVIAPGYGPGVVDALVAKRKNTRLLEASAPVADRRHLRPITGGMLVQEPHHFAAPRSEWKVVTKRVPTDAEWSDAELAMRVCGWVKSNSIVLVKDGVAWGIGAGQQNRVEAGQIAAAKAAGRATGGACASDAFYPFPDGIEAAASAGVAVIVQPGGSVRDEENIAKADELGVAMVFTGERHFLH
jgi:phosphoribosylaminoimidazolecarboxamide formyltransferase/IMP cyclohydrolase